MLRVRTEQGCVYSSQFRNQRGIGNSRIRALISGPVKGVLNPRKVGLLSPWRDKTSNICSQRHYGCDGRTHKLLLHKRSGCITVNLGSGRKHLRIGLTQLKHLKHTLNDGYLSS